MNNGYKLLHADSVCHCNGPYKDIALFNRSLLAFIEKRICGIVFFSTAEILEVKKTEYFQPSERCANFGSVRIFVLQDLIFIMKDK